MPLVRGQRGSQKTSAPPGQGWGSPSPFLTLSFLFSSQLQSELRETLKGSQMGLRLFFTTCRG